MGATRINYCTNPTFHLDVSGWVGVNASVARTSNTAKYGTYSMVIFWTTTAAFGQSVNYTWTGLTVGQTYTASLYIYVPANSISAEPTIRMASPIGTIGNPVTTAAVWSRSSVTFVATAVTHSVTVAPSQAATSGQYCYVDAVLLEGGGTLRTYFDGSFGPADGTYRKWQGAAWASSSIEWQPLTATADPAASPQPRVSLDVGSWTDGPIDVYRVHADGSRHLIWVPDVSGGVTQVYDYSAPLAEPVRYEAHGVILYASNVVTLGVTQPWLSVPGLPGLSMPADVTTKPARYRERQVGMAWPHGRSTPITRGGALRSPALTAQVRTRTDAEADSLADIVEAQTRLLLRLPGAGPRRSWQHVDVTGVREVPDVHYVPQAGAPENDPAHWLVHDIECQVAGDPPAVPFGDPTASYQALTDTGWTYQQLLDWKRPGGTTHLEVLKGGFGEA